MQEAQSQIVIELLQLIDKKREEIKALTCRVMELKDNINNKVEITQLIQKILNNVYFASTPNSHLIETYSLTVFQQLEANENDSAMEETNWKRHVAPQLTRICMEANSWSPLDIDVLMKSSKIVVNVNLPKSINLASIIGKQSNK